jgi:DNA-binding Lrp family transcriptional regulator
MSVGKALEGPSAEGAPRQSGVSPRKAIPRLDETDVEILKFLVQDARISQRALAREIGMSPPAIADRIARLEAEGVIQGYRASIDLEW